MNFEITEEPITAVAALAHIPIAFQVDSIFDVSPLDSGLGGFLLSQRRLDIPYVKDYDTLESQSPSHWSERFDLSNWGLIVARSNDALIGGAVVALNTEGISLLEGRRDLALLWDIRVLPEARRGGIGSALFRAVEVWADARSCKQLKIETQNINVAACRFYARQGCVLGAINRFAYPELPEEVQLVWHKTLSPPAG